MSKISIKYELFQRPKANGKKYYSVRFIDSEGTIFLTKSTRKSTKSEASTVVAKYLTELPLEKLAQAKKAGYQEQLDMAEKLKNMLFTDFVVFIWSSESPYLISKADEGRPLSGEYIENRKRYAERFITIYRPFKQTQLRSISMLLIEGFIRYLRSQGESGNTVAYVLRSLQRPISWAIERDLIDIPFKFSAISRPVEKYKERGILTTEEIRAIVGLPVMDIWVPASGDKRPRSTVKSRPRLPGGKQNQGSAKIDIRMKVAVLLSTFGGLRRGEIRGLRWKSIYFEKRLLKVENNYTDKDGDKLPKKGSVGTIVISDELLTILNELKEVSAILGTFHPDNYALFNTTIDVPIAISTLSRGFRRVLRLIGIEEQAQKDRNLVLHGGRHYAATTIAEKLGERAGKRFTRHKTIRAFQDYSNHDTEEQREAIIEALRLPKNKET